MICDGFIIIALFFSAFIIFFDRIYNETDKEEKKNE